MAQTRLTFRAKVSFVGDEQETAGRTDGLDGGSGEGSLSPHPDLFLPFLDTYILNNRSVNGCSVSRKPLRFLGKLFLCKDYPPNRYLRCKAI